jgi:hypothetical protein
MEVPEKKRITRVMITCLARISQCKDILAYEYSVTNAMVLAENQVPCILHLHKRAMENIMSMIFSISIDEVLTTTKKARNRQAAKISAIINVSAFGKPGNTCTYKVPVYPRTGTVGEVKFDDSRAKDEEAVLPSILSHITAKDPLQSKWIELTAQISSIILEVSQKHDFADDASDSLQLRIYEWALDWILLYGKEGMTNYTHLTVTGQVTKFLRRYRNLYRYSNQGWEYQHYQMKYNTTPTMVGLSELSVSIVQR